MSASQWLSQRFKFVSRSTKKTFRIAKYFQGETSALKKDKNTYKLDAILKVTSQTFVDYISRDLCLEIKETFTRIAIMVTETTSTL